MIRPDADTIGWLWNVLRPDLVVIVGTPLALLATLHALLNKRDVPAAIGWIALAWLAPILGPALYSLFGISRVSRRAREVRQEVRADGAAAPPPPAAAPDGLDALRRAVGTLTGMPLTEGNAFAVLRNGDAAYPAMLGAIEGAGTSVVLTTYILRPDRVGTQFIEALARARGRGVAVRVLVDGIGSGYFLPGAYGRLRRRGVPVARFMHSGLPWRMPFLNLRSHKKLLVVDGSEAFLGGLNIGDEDVLSRRPREPVRDTHFRVEGPVVAQLAGDFARDWFFATGEALPEQAAPGPREAGRAQARAVASGPDEDIEKIEFAVLQACACARRTIHLMTPYFLPDDVLVTALAMASMRGVAVDVLLPARSNHRLVDWASRAHVGPLLDRGVRLWQVPPPFDHSKLLVVDEVWSLIGSANMDARSLRLNFELDVEVYETELAAALVASMRGLMHRRLDAATLRRRPSLARLRDAAARLALPYL